MLLQLLLLLYFIIILVLVYIKLTIILDWNICLIFCNIFALLNEIMFRLIDAMVIYIIPINSITGSSWIEIIWLKMFRIYLQISSRISFRIIIYSITMKIILIHYLWWKRVGSMYRLLRRIELWIMVWSIHVLIITLVSIVIRMALRFFLLLFNCILKTRVLCTRLFYYFSTWLN